MSYSIEETKNILGDNILGLGINPRFGRNPAFESILSHVSNFSLDIDFEKVAVIEEEGKGSFKFISSTGRNYFMVVSKNGDNEFKCISVAEELNGCSEDFDLDTKKKEVLEATVKMDDYGRIVVEKSLATMDSNYSLYTQAEKLCYTKDGIMSDREIKTYGSIELSSSDDLANIDFLLGVPRKAFNGDEIFENNYLSKITMTRVTLDAARVCVDDNRGDGFIYNAILPLNTKEGFRDLILPTDYPEEVTILRISRRKIDAMLKRESNKRVRNGLEYYARGRETFCYSSYDDIGFVCKKKTSNNQK